jgi:hypothetical protein
MPIPGGDSCIRLSGRFTLDAVGSFRRNGVEGYDFEPRVKLGFDTATATANGPLRTVTTLTFRAQEVVAGDEATKVGNGIALSRAFISWSGLTAGVTRSFFDGHAIRGFSGALASSKTLPLLGYTAYFDHGVLASVSLEEADARVSKTPLAADEKAFAPVRPDLVGAFGFERNGFQGKVSGAVRHLEWSLPSPSSDIGFAVQASLLFEPFRNLTALERLEGRRLPQAGSRFSLNAAYAEGATSYLGLSRKLPDVSCQANSRCDRASGFSLSVGYQQKLSETWSTTWTGGYGRLDAGDGSKPGRQWQASGNLVYQPARNLQIGGELAVSVETDRKANATPITTFSPRLRVQSSF